MDWLHCVSAELPKRDLYISANSSLSLLYAPEEQAVAQYMGRPWMQHDYIDWCIVDAMTRYELAAYYYNITNPRPPFVTDFRGVIRTFYILFYTAGFGLPIWGIHYLYDVNSQ
jgi:hypothetical protein